MPRTTVNPAAEVDEYEALYANVQPIISMRRSDVSILTESAEPQDVGVPVVCVVLLPTNRQFVKAEPSQLPVILTVPPRPSLPGARLAKKRDDRTVIGVADIQIAAPPSPPSCPTCAWLLKAAFSKQLVKKSQLST